VVGLCTEKKEKPTLTPLTDVECAEKEDIVFETTVSGKPEPTVEWYEFASCLYLNAISCIDIQILALVASYATCLDVKCQNFNIFAQTCETVL